MEATRRRKDGVVRRRNSATTETLYSATLQRSAYRVEIEKAGVVRIGRVELMDDAIRGQWVDFIDYRI